LSKTWRKFIFTLMKRVLPQISIKRNHITVSPLKRLPAEALAKQMKYTLFTKRRYSLRSILLFANTDVSTTKICLDTSILANTSVLVKSNMGQREYKLWLVCLIGKYVWFIELYWHQYSLIPLWWHKFLCVNATPYDPY
jgi:hypothetical protein